MMIQKMFTCFFYTKSVLLSFSKGSEKRHGSQKDEKYVEFTNNTKWHPKLKESKHWTLN
jgi:hypothetical protein